MPSKLTNKNRWSTCFKYKQGEKATDTHKNEDYKKHASQYCTINYLLQNSHICTNTPHKKKNASSINRHLKNVGPIRYCEPPLQCQSPGVASRMPAIAIAQAACDVHDNNNNDDNV